MPSGIELGLRNVVEDVTPQLGADLDVNGFVIVSTANGDIIITPNGSGNVGINDPTPSNKLSVNGSLGASGTIASGGGLTAINDIATTAGDIHINLDDKALLLGAVDDYRIEWDGDDAVHTISAGSFVFMGGNVGINDAAPAARLDIMLDAADAVALNIDGITNDYTGTGGGLDFALDFRRDLNAGNGNQPTSFTVGRFQVNPKHTDAVIDAGALIVVGVEGIVNSSGTYSVDSTTIRSVSQSAVQAVINHTSTYDSTNTARIDAFVKGVAVSINSDTTFTASGGATNRLITRGVEATLNINPTLSSGDLVVNSDCILISLTGTGIGISTNKGINIATVTGADTNWGIFDASGADWALDGDGQKIFWGEGQDYSIEWDGSDAVHTISAGDFAFMGGNVGIGTTDPVATLDVNGGFAANLVSKTENYTATNSDHVILCDASGGAFTITLPAAGGVTGIIYHIKKIDSSANAVTIDGNSAETIDGDLTIDLALQYESVMIVCDGSNWHIL